MLYLYEIRNQFVDDETYWLRIRSIRCARIIDSLFKLNYDF